MQKSAKYLLKSERTHPYAKSTKDHHPHYHRSLTKDSPRTLHRSHLENTENQLRMGSRAIDLVSTISSNNYIG